MQATYIYVRSYIMNRITLFAVSFTLLLNIQLTSSQSEDPSDDWRSDECVDALYALAAAYQCPRLDPIVCEGECRALYDDVFDQCAGEVRKLINN